MAVVVLAGVVRLLGARAVARPNLLVIGIDTLRADRVGCYGYAKPTSPHIDALARDAVVFDQAISQSPWTLPAFASIFTGLTPSVHGAGRGGGKNPVPFTADVPTLATLLAAAGYQTASFVTNGWVSKDVGLDKGFAETQLAYSRDGSEQMALAWLRAHAHERFFLFVHLLDPHIPYVATAEDLAALGITATPAQVDEVNAFAKGLRLLTDRSPEQSALLQDLYDASVHRSDRRVGTLLAALEESGIGERTIVVIVADHGEELFDRGRLGHGHSLYDELLRVPLIVRFPNGQWRQRIETQVRTMDLMPTMLDVLDVPSPDGLDGVSLLPVIRGVPGAQVPDAPAEFLASGPETKAIRRRDAKLLFVPATGRLVSFDLVRDPRERARLEGAQGRAAELRAELERTFTTRLDGMLFTFFGWAAPHDVHLVLETPTAFEEAALLGSETTDTLIVAPDRTRLDATLHLSAAMSSAAIDMDGVRVRTRDDAPVEVTATVNGVPLDAAQVRLGRMRRTPEGAAPWYLSPTDPRLVVPAGYPAVPEAAFVLAVTSRVSEGEGAATDLPDRTKEHLRVLGYLE